MPSTPTTNPWLPAAAEELWEANQKEEARKAINHAIQQNPDDQQSLILALKIYKASHNKKKSVKLARHLNAQHPNNPESIRFLCEHYQLEKNPDKYCFMPRKELFNAQRIAISTHLN